MTPFQQGCSPLDKYILFFWLLFVLLSFFLFSSFVSASNFSTKYATKRMKKQSAEYLHIVPFPRYSEELFCGLRASVPGCRGQSNATATNSVYSSDLIQNMIVLLWSCIAQSESISLMTCRALPQVRLRIVSRVHAL